MTANCNNNSIYYVIIKIINISINYFNTPHDISLIYKENNYGRYDKRSIGKMPRMR